MFFSKKYLLFFIAIAFCKDLFSQSVTFRDPLSIPIELAANFGEIRTDHYHTGYDIRTNGKTGYAVYAAADGYVSRIKVSANGFGNVLYITHPNGYMTVYAHLDHFNAAISSYVKKQQYAKESFEIELFPTASQFVMKQGELIAYSGNSGGSEGPHLHFEIRDATGETMPINPAKFLPLLDHVAPKFGGMYLYPLTTCCGLAQAFGYAVVGSEGNYHLKIDTIETDYSIVGFGVITDDLMDNSSNIFGVYSLKMEVDGVTYFEMKLDRLDFANGRYVNAHVDYQYQKQEGFNVQKTFVLPNDNNSIYSTLVNNGKVDLSDLKLHRIKISVADYAGNVSQVSFFIHSNQSLPINNADSTLYGAVFKYNRPNTFSSDGVRLNLPANILYDDLYFKFSVIPVNGGEYYSPLYMVHDSYTPLHSYYTISIKPYSIPEALKSKAVIFYESSSGERATKTSHWEGEYLVAQAREFGSFCVRLDTTAPRISTLVKQNQVLNSGSITFKISDDLSGIASYKGLLDGSWILMEYDAKNNLLKCNLDEHILTGAHLLKVVVTDDVDNTSTYELNFSRN